MRRLFVQVYVTFLAVIVLFGVLTTLAWWALHDDDPDLRIYSGMGALLGEVLPPGDAPRDAIDAGLRRLAAKFDAHFAMIAPDGRVLGRSADAEAAPRRSRSFELPLPDGRIIEVVPRRGGAAGAGFLGALGLLALAAAIGAWPLSRRLARRLERLKSRVEALGSGDLSARVEVEGRDEIAALARSFNRAAERIETLVDAQRNTLAAASHELRSPLARIRMAVALLADDAEDDMVARIDRDIEELDHLIDEILLASRLGMEEWPARSQPVDLEALAAREAARARADFRGAAAIVSAEEHLLRHLLRNLFDNARRHAPGAAVAVTLRKSGPDAVLGVADGGAGVAEEDRERIFEAFRSTSSGSGLGLFLVRRIARRYGGEAICRANPGGGALFEVTLPLHRETAAPGVSTAPAA